MRHGIVVPVLLYITLFMAPRPVSAEEAWVLWASWDTLGDSVPPLWRLEGGFDSVDSCGFAQGKRVIQMSQTKVKELIVTGDSLAEGKVWIRHTDTKRHSVVKLLCLPGALDPRDKP